MMLLVCMYVFKTDCLALDNQPTDMFFRGEDHLSHSQLLLLLLLPVVFSAVLRPCSRVLVQFGMITGVTVVWLILGQPCWWDFMDLAFDVTGSTIP